MAYDFYEINEITEIEDRLRTVLENLRSVRESAEAMPNGGVDVQLASCDPLLKRLEKLTFNAAAKAKKELYDSRRKARKEKDRATAAEVTAEAIQRVKKKKGE